MSIFAKCPTVGTMHKFQASDQKTELYVLYSARYQLCKTFWSAYRLLEKSCKFCNAAGKIADLEISKKRNGFVLCNSSRWEISMALFVSNWQAKKENKSFFAYCFLWIYSSAHYLLHHRRIHLLLIFFTQNAIQLEENNFLLNRILISGTKRFCFSSAFLKFSFSKIQLKHLDTFWFCWDAYHNMHHLWADI